LLDLLRVASTELHYPKRTMKHVQIRERVLAHGLPRLQTLLKFLWVFAAAFLYTNKPIAPVGIPVAQKVLDVVIQKDVVEHQDCSE